MEDTRLAHADVCFHHGKYIKEVDGRIVEGSKKF